MSKFSISLSVDSGPKKGETLDRKPGSVIRIGRVVKGNTLAIKDPSISQKHFTVEFDPLVSRWVLTDLSASNATSVNDGLLSGSSVPLSDGDLIKIGESTSISVRVSPIERGNGGRRTRNRKEDGILGASLDGRVEVPNNSRRNSLDVEENNDEVAEDGRIRVSENLGRGRRGRSAAVSKKVEVLEPGLYGKIELPDSATINCAAVKENKDEIEVDNGVKVTENLGRGRRGRSAAVSKKDEILEPGLYGKIELPDSARINCADVQENKDEIGVENGVKVTENLGRGRKSHARTSKKGEILDRGLEDERIEVVENSGGNSSDVKEGKKKAVEDGSKVPAKLERLRRGKSATVSKKDGVVQDDIINTMKDLRRGRRTVPIQISEKDPSMDLILEDPVGNSSSIFVENENSEPPVEGCIEEAPKKLGRGRRNYKKDMVLEDKSEASKTAEVSEEDNILNSVAVDKSSVPKNDNLEPRDKSSVEVSKNLGRGRRNSKKEAVLQDKNEVPKTTGKGRGRRTRSTKVSEVDENLNSVAEDKISVPNNAGRGRRTRTSKLEETSNITEDESGIEAPKKLGRGKQRADSSKASKTDGMLNVITEDAIIKERPRRTYSSKVSKTDEMFGVVVQNAVAKPKRRRADSSKVSKTEEMPDVASKDAVVKEKPRKAAARNTRASSKVSKDEQLLKSSLDPKSSVLNPVENSYELNELKEDFHRLSKQAKIQQTSDADAKDKIVVWNGNGIPNTTNKYKEDQKICWHGTPFEERVERALSDDRLFPQRNHTN